MHSSLSFSVCNTAPPAKKEAVLFKDVPAGFNKLELTLTNNGPDLELKGGDPVSEAAQGPETPCGFYLNLSAVLACGNDALGTMEVSSPGWGAMFFAGGGGSWAICPTQNITLKEKENLVILISNITLGKGARTNYLTIDYLNLSQCVSDSFQLRVLVAEKPRTENKDLSTILIPEWVDNQSVYLTTDLDAPFLNKLAFSLRNNGNSPIKAGPTTEVTFSFVFGEAPGYGALCSTEAGKTIQTAQTSTKLPSWKGGKDTSGLAPIWRFQPQGIIVGTEENALISFDITQLVSTLEPGKTLMYISWINVPDYNSGQTSLEINKLLPPVIHLFKVSPDSLTFEKKDDEKEVILQWKVLNWTDKLIIVDETSEQASGEKKKSIAYVEGGVDALLNVVYGGGRYDVQQSLHIPTIIPPPVINKFPVSPQLLKFREEETYTTKIEWDVGTAEEVYFSEGNIPGRMTLAGSCNRVFTLDEMRAMPGFANLIGAPITLNAKGYAEDQKVSNQNPVFMLSRPSTYPDYSIIMGWISDTMDIPDNDFSIRQVYLGYINLSDTFLKMAFGEMNILKELISLVRLVHPASLHNPSKWELINSYVDRIRAVLRQIEKVKAEHSDQIQFRVHCLSKRIFRDPKILASVTAKIGSDGTKTLQRLVKDIMKIHECLFQTDSAELHLEYLLEALKRLAAYRSVADAEAVLENCAKLVDFVYLLEKFPTKK